MLDDGRATDGHGRVVNFKNTIVILTSNTGAEHVLEAKGDPEQARYVPTISHDPRDSPSCLHIAYAPEQADSVRQRVLDALREKYRPEFLNRLDEMVVFHPLGLAQLRDIARLQLVALQARLQERRISLRLSEAALDTLTALGHNPEYGARPLKRAVQTELETPLARALLAQTVADGDAVEFVPDPLDEGKLVLTPWWWPAVEVPRDADGEAAEAATAAQVDEQSYSEDDARLLRLARQKFFKQARRHVKVVKELA